MIPKFENCVIKSFHAPSGTHMYTCKYSWWSVKQDNEVIGYNFAKYEFDRRFDQYLEKLKNESSN